MLSKQLVTRIACLCKFTHSFDITQAKYLPIPIQRLQPTFSQVINVTNFVDIVLVLFISSVYIRINSYGFRGK